MVEDSSPFTPDQQVIIRLLGRMVGIAFNATLEARLNVAAMQELLKARRILSEDEWQTAVAHAEERWRTAVSVESLEDQNLDQLLAEFNRRLGEEDH